MDIMRFISQFLYRIRYWLLWGTIFVTSLVIYFTQFLPYSYTVKSSLYAGITTSTSLDGSAINFGVVTSTYKYSKITRHIRKGFYSSIS